MRTETSIVSPIDTSLSGKYWTTPPAKGRGRKVSPATSPATSNSDISSPKAAPRTGVLPTKDPLAKKRLSVVDECADEETSLIDKHQSKRHKREGVTTPRTAAKSRNDRRFLETPQALRARRLAEAPKLHLEYTGADASVRLPSGAVVPTDIIRQCRDTLTLRLSKTSVPDILIGLDEQYRVLKGMIENTIRHGEKHSALLTGMPGSGKSMLLEYVFRELRNKLSESFSVVRLSGTIHTDDMLAMKGIVQQLQIEMETEVAQKNSTIEHMRFVCMAVKKSKKPIIFVLEEFDLFAQRRKQILIYNLLDLFHSHQARIALVGLTCRLDACELMEKRVRSRFSHRQINFLGIQSIEEYEQILSSTLTLPTPAEVGPLSTYVQEHNDRLKEILSSSKLKTVLNLHHAIDNHAGPLFTMATLAVCRLKQQHPLLDVEDFEIASEDVVFDPFTTMMEGLTRLELIILVCMKKLEQREVRPYNFEVIYSEYRKFSRGTSQQDQYNKDVCLKAFEHLLAIEFAKCDSRSTTLLEYRSVQLVPSWSDIDDAIQACNEMPSVVKKWAETQETGDTRVTMIE
mmetsp:Transcript_51761/g.86025  ORF Transcript_51761/g.86025 Transcript_51761/m.86025 type:complete len:572 (+) Transcript_51761:160-1875(+)